MKQDVAQVAGRPQTVEEVAALLSYHAESIRRAIRQGRIRALKFGRGWRIPPEEVARVLAEGMPAQKPKIPPRCRQANATGKD